jgi:hypothetical protein
MTDAVAQEVFADPLRGVPGPYPIAVAVPRPLATETRANRTLLAPQAEALSACDGPTAASPLLISSLAPHPFPHFDPGYCSKDNG